MVQVMEIARFGKDGLQRTERALPAPGPGQVRIRMGAVSLNYRDLMMLLGLYNPRQSLPLIPCSDGAGTVVAVGEGVNTWRPGDRVMGVFAQDWLDGEVDGRCGRRTLGGPLDGMLAEEVILPETGLVHSPDSLSDAEAACLPCAGVTAWHALVGQGAIKSGDTVLVIGTGGVSLFALQIACAHGARVIVVSRSEEKLARARALGASAGICSATTPNWGKAVQALTDGRGVDHVVEVGGAGTLAQSVEAVRPGGRIAIIGVLSGVSSQIDLRRVLMRSVRLQGLFVGSRRMLEDLSRAVDTTGLKPVIDRAWPWQEAGAAFDYLASGQQFGKVVLTW
ncbi:MAG TPA: NAD(P)-dependent alcohol dehydrogenase [Candidatus Acidoferrales bacterium]|nr:NAD(P)-dependent alcohol dehydrogenase [Candidatus Acidoferrales bacterium]